VLLSPFQPEQVSNNYYYYHIVIQQTPLLQEINNKFSVYINNGTYKTYFIVLTGIFCE